MVEVVACLKFLAYGSHVSWIGAKLRLEALEEVQLAVEFHAVAQAGATAHNETLGINIDFLVL